MFTRRFVMGMLLVMAVSIGGAFVFSKSVEVANARGAQTCRGANFNGGFRSAGIFQSACGYFTDRRMSTASSINAYILTGGVYAGAPVGTQVDKTTYINSILDRLYNGSPRDRMGAAFIIQTMRGNVAGADWNTNNPPTPDQIQDWRNRINNPSITIQVESMGGTALGHWVGECRPYYSGGNGQCQEDAFINITVGNEPSVVFRNNGAVVYAQRTKCANTFGNLTGGLPQGVNYNLTPTVSVNPSVSESGGSVTTTSTVNNGGTTAATGVNWQISTFTLNSNEAIPGGGTTAAGTPPQAYYGHNAANASSGAGTFQPGITSPNPIPNLTQILGDYPVGTKVCYGLSVRPYSHTTTDWRHSAAVCLVIAKKPRVQIWGGDLWVGRSATSNVVTSTTTKNVGGTNRIFGSWAEYGVLASGTVTGFGSGAGYSGGATSTLLCDVHRLTFTNAGTATCSDSTAKGGYAMTSLLPAVSERLAVTAALPGNTANLQNTATGSYSANGAVTLTNGVPASSAMNIAKKKWIVINAPGQTVTIKNNIVYTNDTIQSIGDIPQVVIIANQINIDAGVTQVDAWLIASGTNGTINTCSEITDPTSQLNANKCNQRLIVNGPVVARKLQLYRTFGSGTGLDTGTPAEVFNFRPDAYLWATSYSLGSGRLQTVSTKELPPRF